MKQIIDQSRQEIKKLLSNSFFKLALFVIAILPLLYSVLYLWAFWDPYNNLKNIPVAIVNEDSNATYNHQTINYGDNLVSKLKENEVLKWDFVSQSDADTGLQNNKYYAEIVIPNDFSKNIISTTSDTPKQAVIEYKAREANNMIAAQLTKKVTEEIANNLKEEITNNSVKQIFLGVQSSADGLQTAADSTTQIADGQISAIQGAEQVLSGINTIANGTNNLSNAIKSAADGSGTLNAGTNDLYNGMKKLDAGLTDVSAATNTLATGAQTLQTGITQANTGINTYIDANTTALDNIELANELLKKPDEINLTYKVPNKYVAQSILSKIIAQSTNTQTTQQISDLKNGMNQLTTGSATLSSGISTLNTSITGSVIPGAKTIENGLEKSSLATQTLSDGLSSIYTGSQKLTDGVNSLSAGQEKLISGLNTINNGTNTLADKLNEGATTAKDQSNTEKVEKLVPIISNPVNVANNSIDTVKNYGTGFAPYFIPLSLWVGGLVLFLLIKLEPQSEDEKRLSPLKLALSKFILLASVGTIQTIILDTVLILALGLHPTNYVLFFTFTILASWCFVAILQLFVMIFQDGGKFLGIVFLMLQLTSASGTYPVETSPVFFQKINAYLPMTYVVKGLREIISGANITNITHQYWTLAGFFTGALVLIMICSKIVNKRSFNLSIEKQYEH